MRRPLLLGLVCVLGGRRIQVVILPATASLNIACWNVRSLSVDNDCDAHCPRKSALINLELARLSTDICALSETWLTGTGST